MLEELQIREAQVEEVADPVAEKAERARKDYFIEVVLILILGILVGIAVKTEATKRITIGFNDYRMKIGEEHYNINELQKDLLEKRAEAGPEELLPENPEDGEVQPTE